MFGENCKYKWGGKAFNKNTEFIQDMVTDKLHMNKREQGMYCLDVMVHLWKKK